MSRKKVSTDALDELLSKLKEITPTLEKLPAEVRSQAFDLLKPFIRGTPPPKDEVAHDSHDDDDQPTGSMEDFFSKFDHKKPNDNVTLIAAWYYNQHGLTSLTKPVINQIASDVGITIPNRADMTLRNKTVKGKSYFQKKGTGYIPTVHGETFLKQTYKVKKGNKPVPLNTKSSD